MALSQENKIVLTTEQNDPDAVVSLLKHSSRFDGVAIILGAIAFIAMVAFIMQGVWPFLSCFALFLLLFPYREYRSARVIMFTAGILIGFWLFVTLAGVLFPFIIGLLIAYLFNPLVTIIEARWRVTRGWSALVIVILLCAVVGFLGYLFIPSIINELQALLATVSNYFQGSTMTLDEDAIRQFFLNIGLPQKFVDQYVTGEIIPRLKDFYAELPKVLIVIISAIPTYIEKILDLIIIPIAAIYFLKDWRIMIESIQSLIPQRHRPAFISTFNGIDRVLYGYIRGQSVVAIIIGIIGAIVLTILGVPYAALLGLCIALLDLIPIIGLILSIVIIEGVILLTLPITFSSVMIGIIVVAGLHLFEAYFLGPKIVGKGIGIPPIIVIISIFAFGYFLGFLGMLIAVPLTGIIMLFMREYRQALVEHPLM
jgi:predicted PurR-regulated permease PerM